MHGIDNQRDAKLVGERLREIVLRTRRAIWSDDVSRRAVTCDNT